MTWNFEPINKNHQRSDFDCGYPILNQCLKQYARQNHLRSIAKTFVAVSELGGLKVDGYYTISSSAIPRLIFSVLVLARRELKKVMRINLV